MKETVFRAFADPHRRHILKILGKRPMTAGEIAAEFTLAKSTLSGHFSVLKSADLIQEERRGTSIVYSLNLSVVEETLTSLMDLLDTEHQPQTSNRSKTAEQN
ncbi:MAG: autorepressor SdpR family transcription factor [Dehalococcoidales bacterium]|nr:autorepressor SdpR family transcription factor [Dehalococcoidales bacterium]